MEGLLLKIKLPLQSDTCVPRGTEDINWFANDPIVFQALNWKTFDAGFLPEVGETKFFEEERQNTVYITGCTRTGADVVVRTTFNPYFLVKTEMPINVFIAKIRCSYYQHVHDYEDIENSTVLFSYDSAYVDCE